MSHKFRVGDKVMVNYNGKTYGPVEITEFKGPGRYVGLGPNPYDPAMGIWDLGENDIILYVDNQAPVHEESTIPQWIHGDFKLEEELPTSEVKEPVLDPKDCKWHNWVTTTMFRFDTTYCTKCGIEKGKE